MQDLDEKNAEAEDDADLEAQARVRFSHDDAAALRPACARGGGVFTPATPRRTCDDRGRDSRRFERKGQRPAYRLQHSLRNGFQTRDDEDDDAIRLSDAAVATVETDDDLSPVSARMVATPPRSPRPVPMSRQRGGLRPRAGTIERMTSFRRLREEGHDRDDEDEEDDEDEDDGSAAFVRWWRRRARVGCCRWRTSLTTVVSEATILVDYAFEQYAHFWQLLRDTHFSQYLPAIVVTRIFFRGVYFIAARIGLRRIAAVPRPPRGDKSRQRRGCHVESPRRHVAAPPRPRRG